jgi:hypothetical protein
MNFYYRLLLELLKEKVTIEVSWPHGMLISFNNGPFEYWIVINVKFTNCKIEVFGLCTKQQLTFSHFEIITNACNTLLDETFIGIECVLEEYCAKCLETNQVPISVVKITTLSSNQPTLDKTITNCMRHNTCDTTFYRSTCHFNLHSKF